MFGSDEVFGRSAVIELLELKNSGASKFLSNLLQADIIEPVSGHGKGKYKRGIDGLGVVDLRHLK